jgi:hypothetical protein
MENTSEIKLSATSVSYVRYGLSPEVPSSAIPRCSVGQGCLLNTSEMILTYYCYYYYYYYYDYLLGKNLLGYLSHVCIEGVGYEVKVSHRNHVRNG